MMGLSSLGGGGGNSSSSSNLSASAPPFTVDRLNPKPNSNPQLHYSDSQYVVSHTLQYTHLSTPRTEPVIDSSGIITVPFSDGYQFLPSASVSPSSSQWYTHNSAYGGDVNPPYNNPCVPPLVGEESRLAEDEGSRYNVVLTSGSGVKSQHDYDRKLYDLVYEPRWADFDDGKRTKRSEFDRNFSSERQYGGGSHGYENQSYRVPNKFKEDSDVLYENLNKVSEREAYTGSSSTGYMGDKSCLEQQLGFFHYDSSKTLLTPSGSPYPESYPSVMSCAIKNDFVNHQNPYEKSVRTVDTHFPGGVSVTRSSPTVVIRPPPATNLNLGLGACSHKPAGIHIVNSDYSSPSRPNDSGLKSNNESFETCLLKSSKQGNTRVPSISVKELSSPPHAKDPADCKIKAKLGYHVPDVNVSSDNMQVVNSSEESSEFLDNHNTGVDSPCWRGAPSSQFSMFDIEPGDSKHVKIDIDEQYGFDHEERQSLLSTIDSNRVLSEKVACSTGDDIECGKTGETRGLEKPLDKICSTAEQISFNSTIDRAWIPPPARSSGVELSGVPNMMMGELNYLNNLKSVFDIKVSDTEHLFGEDVSGMTVNVASEGAAVAVHAAENVLASPASHEDEQITIPDPKLDVPAIVKTIHSLSELLRFQISSGIFSLGEENTEILKHVIASLTTCLSAKRVQAQTANNPEPKYLVGETSGILEESSSMGIFSGVSRTKCKPSNSCTNPDNLNFEKGERNCIFTGKKDEISPIISPLRDDLHITGDDDMAKAINTVLEQNFLIEENVDSQALLFKSLWLESEAKLCSISYKARFERMKSQMEEIKLKALKANEYIAEMSSAHSMSPDPITVFELATKARGGTFPKITSSHNSGSGVSQHADGVESSVLARFNILKSREENPNPINTEEQRSEVVAGNHADSVMARFNILKSREENSKVISMDEKTPPQVVNNEFAGEKYFQPHFRSQSEDVALDVALQPDFKCESGSSSGGKLNSYAGYESPIDAANDPEIPLRDSSSDWEHVLKEDFSLKN